MRAALAVVSILLLFEFPASADDTSFAGLVPRTEILAFGSLTLSDEQFLKGDANGTNATLGGELRIARLTGQQPLVMLMHGSGGIGANVGLWVRDLNCPSSEFLRQPARQNKGGSGASVG